MTRPTRTALSAGLIAASLTLVLLSVLTGVEEVRLVDALRDWRTGVSLRDSVPLQLLLIHRLPRTLAAVLAGAGLAIAGCSFQALLRNPLATPYTLGIASAGALGAWASVVALDAFSGGILVSTNDALATLGLSLKQVAAFALAGADMLLIYFIASRRRRISPAVLLLAGVTLGMMANAGIVLLRYLARPDKLVATERWLMGGVAVLGYDEVIRLAVGVLPCALILALQGAKYDQLGFSPEIAAGRGVNVVRLQRLTFFVGSLMTALIVSEVGPIGFVGLVVPHCVRMVAGAQHRILMPLCLVAGGAFLCFCDIIARQLLTQETPIGVITALIGVPFFIALMLRRGFTDWEN